MAEEKKFEGTILGADAGKSVDADVDALIQGALKELDTTKKEDKPQPTAKTMAGTQIKTSSVPKQPSPKQEKKAPSEQQYDATFKEYKPGDIVSGTVLKIDTSGALVDIGYMSDAMLRKDSFSGQLKVGDKVSVMIEKLESRDGYVIVSKTDADEKLKWDRAFDAYKKRTLLEAAVKSVVKGGLLVECSGIQGFIPASQVAKKAGQELDSFAGKTIPVKIIQINQHQGKIVMSHRQAAGESGHREAQKIFETLETGQIKKGKVSSLKSFGAFIDLGGVEGLVHLSELSWKRVKHPGEVLKVGDEIEVLVLGVDKNNKKISLGMKELQPDPWEKASEKYRPGQIVKVKVLRFVKFGIFVELDEALEGLVHISEISPKKFEKMEDVIKIGDIVDAKVLRVLPDQQKIGLSIRQVAQDKERAIVDEELKKQEQANKVTIGDMIAEKERQKEEAEGEEEEEQKNEVSGETQPDNQKEQ